ncbi:unnamed protein product [Rotaria sordida]|uniref:Uncharacterized protein n=1 Tax=Rotaria sordida TaxID=392033 RepID=A0A819SZY5_9BILA|nr:unnamed protein product [Rotaria sordida]
MYPIPSIPYTFNHQLFNQQSRRYFKHQNGIIQSKSRNNIKIQQTNLLPNSQSYKNQIIFPSSNSNIISNNPSISHQFEKFTKKRTPKLLMPSRSHQEHLFCQELNPKNILSKRCLPLFNSRSVGCLEDRIKKERKSHTMPPLSKILGPCSTPKAKLFASIIAPTDAQAIKANQLAQNLSNINSIYDSKSDRETIDDDTPIFVHVQYDPQTSSRPDQNIIRQTLNNQLFNQINKQEAIILNFLGPNIKANLPVRVEQQQQQSFNQSTQFIKQNSSRRIPVYCQKEQQINDGQNHFLPPRVSRPSNSYPSMATISHPVQSFLKNENLSSSKVPRPFINRQQVQSNKVQQLSNRYINSSRSNGYYKTEVDNLKEINRKMSYQPSTISDQEILSRISYTTPSSNEIYRPTALTDTPELSRENLLVMLNQIPDLQGRRFKIEYASSGIPEAYPIPINLGSAANTYPEPVYIDRLPNDVIQHVKSSNNPAITAALEATIQREQYLQPTVISQPTNSSLYYQPPTVLHHAAQPHEQVQQSRPFISKNLDKNTQLLSSSSSSSSSTSSEESDSEDFESISSGRPRNSIETVGKQYSSKIYPENEYD